MNWLQALLLGIIQGLTEYLPVSSSGHLAIGQALFGLEDGESNLTFTVLLHVATVLSTLVILWKEIVWIFKDLFTKQSWNGYQNLNGGTKYAINILIRLRSAHRGHHALGNGLIISLLLFRQTEAKGEHQPRTRFHYRYRPSLRRHAGFVALRLNDCHRFATRQQKGKTGPILLPDGHSAHLG